MSADHAKNAILGSLAADAAAAGLHWVYDPEEVRRRGGDAPEFHPTAESEYHSDRAVGEPTFYGALSLVALESLVERRALDEEDYIERVLARFAPHAWNGYRDKALKAIVRDGRASRDAQAGAFACLPAVVAFAAEEPAFDSIVTRAIRTTHDSDDAALCGLVAADAIRAAVHGVGARGSIEAAAARGGAAGEIVRGVLDAEERDHTAFAGEVGRNCPVVHSLPVALHAALVSSGWLDGVRRSILAGGDSCGRLLVAGAILGAADGVPEEALARLADPERIEALVERLLGRA